jgi:hypothetical protein
MNRGKLIKKLKSKTEFLSKEESDQLGPVTSRDLAPITGDSFCDGIIERELNKLEVSYSRIERDTAILVFLIADGVFDEVLSYLFGMRKLEAANLLQANKQSLIRSLIQRSEDCYASSPDFKKKLNGHGNKGRDTLIVFQRHWLAAELQKNYFGIFQEIPRAFANGEPLRA